MDKESSVKLPERFLENYNLFISEFMANRRNKGLNTRDNWEPDSYIESTGRDPKPTIIWHSKSENPFSESVERHLGMVKSAAWHEWSDRYEQDYWPHLGLSLDLANGTSGEWNFYNKMEIASFLEKIGIREPPFKQKKLTKEMRGIPFYGYVRNSYTGLAAGSIVGIGYSSGLVEILNKHHGLNGGT